MPFDRRASLPFVLLFVAGAGAAGCDSGAELEFGELADGDLPRTTTIFMEKMELEDWTAAGMQNWAVVASERGSLCSDCHDRGWGGFFIDMEAARSFEWNRDPAFIYGFIRLENDVIVPAMDKITSYVGTPTGGGRDTHPRLVALNGAMLDRYNAAVAAIPRWIELTNARD